MESAPPRSVRLPMPPPVSNHALWLLGLLALLAVHGWRTLALFGPERPWERLLDGEPLLSGRHPLHLYHGYLGARALRERGTTCCYDPAFCAGYPKTPVFDGGSRPAELALYLAGGAYRPGAYKLAVALIWGLAPGLVWLAARAAGHARADALLAAALGLLVWWGRPCRELLDAGDLDLPLAAALAVAHLGLLLRYHQRPGPGALAGVGVTSLLSWFAHPLLTAGLVPLFLIYYVSVGPRHRLTWHAALLGALLAALAANGFWLRDWLSYWWIRLPPELEAGLRPGWSLAALWAAPLWGGPADRALAGPLLAAAAAGVMLYNATGRRTAARLFGLTALGLLALAAAGSAWTPLARLGSAQLLAPALLVAAVPAAHLLAAACRALGRRRLGGPAAVLAAAAAAAAAWLTAPELLNRPQALLAPEPLALGLGPRRARLIDALRRRTTAEARILWEDRRGGKCSSRWPALLPLLTGRALIGGLDPDAGIEHAAPGLCDQALAGRPLDDWGDDELALYCDSYNIGWVVCWTPGAARRFRSWGGRAEELAELDDPDGGGAGVLFEVRRQRSFARRGAVGWMAADARRLVLGEVTPENGEVVLCVHYQAGLRAAPARVRLDDRPWTVQVGFDSLDAIGFVRLRVDEFTPRITLTWDPP
jgi:hypothetical protein